MKFEEGGRGAKRRRGRKYNGGGELLQDTL
jgi:hypothetical protein